MIASVSRTKEWILASCEKNVKSSPFAILRDYLLEDSPISRRGSR